MNAILFHLRAASFLLLGLALAHGPIARHFKWRAESERLSPFNRQAFLVHAFFIAFAIGLLGALMLFWPQAFILPSLLGQLVAATLTIFWTFRLYTQWGVYEHTLWRGKRFETTVHLLFTVFWIYLIVLFAWCFSIQRHMGRAP